MGKATKSQHIRAFLTWMEEANLMARRDGCDALSSHLYDVVQGEDPATRLAAALWSARLHADHGVPPLPRLFEIATRADLETGHVLPMGKFHYQMARSCLRSANGDGAALHASLADPTPQQAPLLLGAALLRSGRGKSALSYLEQAWLLVTSESERAAAADLLASVRRMRGEFTYARKVLTLSGSGDANAVALLLGQAYGAGEADDICKQLASIKPSAGDELMFWLWNLSVKSPHPGFRTPRNIKRSAPSDFDRRHADYPLYTYCRTLEQASAEKQVVDRVQRLVPILEGPLTTRSTEQELLVLAAAARLAVRWRQQGLADTILMRLQSLALLVTDGMSDDISGALGDLQSKSLVATKDAGEPQTHLKHTGMGPITEFAKTLARVGYFQIKGRWERAVPGRRDQDEIKMETFAKSAQAVTGYLGARKGTMLKIGQIASYILGPMHEVLANQFESLQADVPSMSYEVILKVLHDETGKMPDELFAAFDKTPFAAGSIGQVHRATSFAGESLAVKIQYPEIEKLIDLDFRRAFLMRPFIQRMLPSLDFASLHDEIFQHILEETDYEREADNMELFEKAFANNPLIVIPKVDRSLSTRRMLVMEFLQGMRFQEFATTASQTTRDRASRTIFEAIYSANIRHGVFNADTNPGNFLFQNDGRVAFLDFGCVKKFAPAFNQRRNEMLRYALLGDKMKLHRIYCELGFVQKQSDATPDDVLQIFQKILEYALVAPEYKFHANLTGEIFRTVITDNPHRPRWNLPRELFFSSRIETGLVGVLGQLGASGPWQQILCELLQLDPALVRSPAQLSRGA